MSFKNIESSLEKIYKTLNVNNVNANGINILNFPITNAVYNVNFAGGTQANINVSTSSGLINCQNTAPLNTGEGMELTVNSPNFSVDDDIIILTLDLKNDLENIYLRVGVNNYQDGVFEIGIVNGTQVSYLGAPEVGVYFYLLNV